MGQWVVGVFRRVKSNRKRAIRVAALVGVVLALVCHFLPADYQQVCSAVARVVPLACGAL